MTKADLLKALWDAGNVEIAADEAAKTKADALTTAQSEDEIARNAKKDAEKAFDAALADYNATR